jgi:hypothetical protein
MDPPYPFLNFKIIQSLCFDGSIFYESKKSSNFAGKVRNSKLEARPKADNDLP